MWLCCVLLIGVVIVCFNYWLLIFGLFGIGGFVWGNEYVDVIVFDVLFDFYEYLFIVMLLGDGCY